MWPGKLGITVNCLIGDNVDSLIKAQKKSKFMYMLSHNIGITNLQYNKKAKLFMMVNV